MDEKQSELRLPPFYLNDPASEGPEEDLLLPTFEEIQDQTKPAISSELEWPTETQEDVTGSPLPEWPDTGESPQDISLYPPLNVEEPAGPLPVALEAPQPLPGEEVDLAPYEPPAPSGGPSLLQETHLPELVMEDEEPAPDLPEPFEMQTGGSTDTPDMPAVEEIEKPLSPDFPFEVDQDRGLPVTSQDEGKEEEQVEEPYHARPSEPEEDFPVSEEEPTASASDNFASMLDHLKGMSDSLDQLVQDSRTREQDSFRGQGIPRFVLPTRYDQ